jgi:fructose-bisphosphate aldolase class 1
MRSTITAASQDGVAAVAAQQFELAARIGGQGLVPIIETEVSINAPDKAGAEALLLAELSNRLDALPTGSPVMLKLTLPQVPDLYAGLAQRDDVVRVLALSGGYTRTEACARLAQNHHMIASFSRTYRRDRRNLRGLDGETGRLRRLGGSRNSRRPSAEVSSPPSPPSNAMNSLPQLGDYIASSSFTARNAWSMALSV